MKHREYIDDVESLWEYRRVEEEHRLAEAEWERDKAREGVSQPLEGGSAPLQWVCWRCRAALDDDGYCSACGGGWRPKPKEAA